MDFGESRPRLSNVEGQCAWVQALGLSDALKEVRVLHIGGTKGKGSTAAFTSQILQSCGFSVGLFTSPHLCDVRERIRINGCVCHSSTSLPHHHGTPGARTCVF
jgi:folylpolyglutamate synthase